MNSTNFNMRTKCEVLYNLHYLIKSINEIYSKLSIIINFRLLIQSEMNSMKCGLVSSNSYSKIINSSKFRFSDSGLSNNY